MDVPAGVTQEEGNTGFSIHLLSAVLALIFLARRIQPFLSLVDREVEFCVLTIYFIVLHPLGIFIFIFKSFSEKNPVCRDRTHVPTCQRLHGTSELPGRPTCPTPKRPQFCTYCLKKNLNASRPSEDPPLFLTFSVLVT